MLTCAMMPGGYFSSAPRLLLGSLELDYSVCRRLRAKTYKVSPWIGSYRCHTSRNVEYNEMKERFKSMEINRIFVLEKVTKYDLELRNGLEDHEIRRLFPLAYRTHVTHMKLMESLIKQLRDKFKLHTIVVKAQSHNLSLIDVERAAFPPDLVISAGGDGTFLEAASLMPPTKLGGKPLWIAGINTDPERSMGALCLSYFNRWSNPFKRTYVRKASQYSDDDIPKQNLIRFKEARSEAERRCASESIGEKEWNDIASASFCGMKSEVDTSAPDQCAVISRLTTNIYDLTYDEYIGNLLDRLLVKRDCRPVCRQKIRVKLFKRSEQQPNIEHSCKADSSVIEQSLFCGTPSEFGKDELNGRITRSGKFRLPLGAVNDIMIADRSFGKTFYALVQVEDSPIMQVKSSGVLVTTGTGSTAWAYNMCKVSINRGIRLFNHLVNHPQFPKETAGKITQELLRDAIESHNDNLIFDASSSKMKCIIREGIGNVASTETSSFKGKQITILSLSKTAQLLIDGSKTVDMDYGDVVVLKTFDSDVLWSCV